MSYRKTDWTGIFRHETDETKYRVDTTATVDGTTHRRRKTLTGATLEEAIQKRDEIKAQLRAEAKAEREPEAESRGEASSIRPTSIAWLAINWAKEMGERGRWSQRTLEHNLQNLRHHILPEIGGIEAGDLTREDLRYWIDCAEDKRTDAGQRYAQASLQRWWRIVRHLVKALYLEGYVDRRLVEWTRDVRGPKGAEAKRRETRTLTAGELAEYVAAAQRVVEPWHPHIALLAYTGMRFGESAGLEWGDIDWTGGLIRIERSYSRGRLGPTKTGESRTVPMAPQVSEALEAQRERLMRDQNLGLADGIVFPSNVGTRRGPSCIHKPMQAAAAAAGLDIKVGPQVLRKTFNTLLGNLGVRREMIKSITGHETDEMHAHYTEIRSEDQLAAVEKLFKTAGGAP